MQKPSITQRYVSLELAVILAVQSVRLDLAG